MALRTCREVVVVLTAVLGVRLNLAPERAEV